MPAKEKGAGNKAEELMEKILVLQMYEAGSTQNQIAKAIGRRKRWVNDFLKHVPKNSRQS